MSERHLSEITQSDQLLKRLSHEAQALLALDQAFKRLLPAVLRPVCQAVRIRDDELVVYAHNGIAAARLRMNATSLLPELAKQGYVASKVRVKIDLKLAAKPPPPKTIQISEQALDGIEHQAQHIANPMVSQAVATLIAHHRQRIQDHKP